MQATPSQITGGAAGVLEGSGGSSGPVQHTTGDASNSRSAQPVACKWRISAWRLWGNSASTTCMKPSDDDILTLRGCQHAFHAKCLSSWFLIERYDCPVCRNLYWQSREEKARAARAPPGLRLDGGGDGPGIARLTPAWFRVSRPAVPAL
ncbi:hypothetical protein LZ30DRAFT_160068 [Colletotrichum cereale]|nr:hypothetical protein LZ30DRAFT_160068 [Colletotrichum cereale]